MRLGWATCIWIGKDHAKEEIGRDHVYAISALFFPMYGSITFITREWCLICIWIAHKAKTVVNSIYMV